jgi:hypothetical protein
MSSGSYYLLGTAGETMYLHFPMSVRRLDRSIRYWLVVAELEVVIEG